MTTKRHHYLPEFFIKGFLNSDKKVFVYDKLEQRFKSNEFSPKQIFFEWHRNTLEIHGKNDDFIEGLYGHWDNILSKTYEKVINHVGKLSYQPIDLFHLIVFVSLIYWRLPSQDNEVKELIDRGSPDELFIKVYNSKTNEAVSNEFYDEFKKRPGFAR